MACTSFFCVNNGIRFSCRRPRCSSHLAARHLCWWPRKAKSLLSSPHTTARGQRPAQHCRAAAAMVRR
eukprot:6856790-Prymnesium_polylepis.1